MVLEKDYFYFTNIGPSKTDQNQLNTSEVLKAPGVNLKKKRKLIPTSMQCLTII